MVDLVQNPMSSASIHKVDAYVARNAASQSTPVHKKPPKSSLSCSTQPSHTVSTYTPSPLVKSHPQSPQPRSWDEAFLKDPGIGYQPAIGSTKMHTPKLTSLTPSEAALLQDENARLHKKVADLKELIAVKEQVIHKHQEEIRRESVRRREDMRRLSDERTKTEESLMQDLLREQETTAALKHALLVKDQQLVGLQHTVDHLKYVANHNTALQGQADKLDASANQWRKQYEDLKAELELERGSHQIQINKLSENLRVTQIHLQSVEELLSARNGFSSREEDYYPTKPSAQQHQFQPQHQQHPQPQQHQHQARHPPPRQAQQESAPQLQSQPPHQPANTTQPTRKVNFAIPNNNKPSHTTQPSTSTKLPQHKQNPNAIPNRQQQHPLPTHKRN
ncbi:hypothetical protein Pelo_14736 [Pelomyxa schiedti]|nr:hypothetical protein Pelo_14736 [Pelomyxa schiedti]